MATMERPVTLSQVAEQFSNVEPNEFRQQIKELFDASWAIMETISAQVEERSITPVQGVGIVACLTGQLFGYKAFHGELTPADLALSLHGRLPVSH